jgi:hypothetical protein
MCQDVSVLEGGVKTDGERRAKPVSVRSRRRRRGIGGTLVLAGLVGMVVAALHPSWLNVYVEEPGRWREITGGDTVPRTLGELSTRGSVYLAFGLVLVTTAMALARSDRVRRVGGILALPAFAFAVVAVLNAVGAFRLWGAALPTRYPISDTGMDTVSAPGRWWAIAAMAAVTAGTLLLASTVPPPPTSGPPEAR